MKLPELYRIFRNCASVTTDSRNCPEGSLFFALKGASFDGNAFAAEALEAGCAYAVVDEAGRVPQDDPRYILTDNCLHTLQQLANHHRRRLGTPVIAVTGTNGKTTTKELLAAVLSTTRRTLRTQGNLNNSIGVPLTLLRLTEEHDLAVVEMGASHPGDIRELADIAEPDYGIVTNVGKAHLEGFGSLEGVIRAKGELFDFLRRKGGATVFVHHDSPYLADMAEGLEQILYGSADGLYVSGRVTGNSPYLSLEWEAGSGGGGLHRVETRLIGSYNLPNVLAAVAVGRFFGVEAPLIDRALAGYVPRNNRSQLKRTESNLLVIDAYNANPASMRAALRNFRDMELPRKMLILGDMRELGADSLAEHQEIADYIRESGFEEVWLVGPQFASVRHGFRTFPDVRRLADALKADKPQGRAILLKGSNGVRLESVVEYL